MIYVLAYCSIGLGFVLFDSLTSKKNRAVYLSHPIVIFYQALRWPLSVYLRMRNRSNSPSFKYKKNDPSLYKRWLATKMPEADKATTLTEEMLFVGIMNAVCSFSVTDLKGISIRKPNEDLVFFEIACYLIATTDKWASTNFKESRKDLINSIRSFFASVSSDILKYKQSELENIINQREAIYRKVFESQNSTEKNMGIVTGFICHLIDNDGLCFEEQPLPSLSMAQIPVQLSVQTWTVNFIPATFKIIQNYENYKTENSSKNTIQNKNSLYFNWISEEQPLLNSELKRTDKASLNSISASTTGGRVYFFKIMEAVASLDVTSTAKEMRSNDSTPDLARFELGCYLLFAVKNRITNLSAEEKKALTGKYLATFCSISSEALSVSFNETVGVLTSRFTTYGILAETKKPEKDLIEVLISFISFVIENGSIIESKGRPQPTFSKIRESASKVVYDWAERHGTPLLNELPK